MPGWSTFRHLTLFINTSLGRNILETPHLPGWCELSSLPLQPRPFVMLLPHTGLRAIEPADFRLKSLQLRAKINRSSLSCLDEGTES